MPADIATILGKPAIAYAAGATPWHRLGTASPTTAGFPTVQAALAAASLDWNVTLQPAFARTADGAFVPIPNHFATVRDVDSAALGTVKSRYHVIQNSEAFGVLDAACQQHGVTIETAGALGRGDRVWMLAKLPTTIQPVRGDKVVGYALLVNGHNGWTPYSARLTSVRVVCANTLGAATSETQPFMRLKHVSTYADQLELVEAMITKFAAALKETGATFGKLASVKMTQDQMFAYIDAVLGISKDDLVAGAAAKRRERLRELAAGQAKGSQFAPWTAWQAFNAVTEYVDHERGNKVSARSLRSADQSAIFGPGVQLKRKALELALAA
jgi:phage/plasmid-like protein (TIGR03299 family)